MYIYIYFKISWNIYTYTYMFYVFITNHALKSKDLFVCIWNNILFICGLFQINCNKEFIAPHPDTFCLSFGFFSFQINQYGNNRSLTELLTTDLFQLIKLENYQSAYAVVSLDRRLSTT